MMATIVVTGSVCTGKTTLAKAIASKLKYKYLDVNKIIKNENLSEGFDKVNQCEIVDENKLAKFLEKIVRKGNFVVDSHLSHYLSKKFVDLCIVVKCNLKVLKKRLESRNYSSKKIKDNLEAEIFDTCLEEAKGLGHKILLVDTTKDFKTGHVLKMIKNEA